jgi:hypothetical protein
MYISPVPEDNEKQIKTTDFIVSCSEGSVFIECKSLEDKTKSEGKLWDQIEAKIVKNLGKHQRCWLVTIDAARSILGKDIAEITNLALNQIIENDLTTVCTFDNKVSLSF